MKEIEKFILQNMYQNTEKMAESGLGLVLFGVPIMVKSVSLACRNEAQESLKSDSDIAAAAEKLMHLSGDEEDDKKSTSLVTKKSKDKNEDECMKGAQKKCGLIPSEKIREGDGCQDFKAKKRRYRSIYNIYMETKPMNDFMHRKKLKS